MPQQLFPFSFASDAVTRMIGAFPLSFANVEGSAGKAFHMAYSPLSTWGGMIQGDMFLADSAPKRAGYLSDDTMLMGHKLLQGHLEDMVLTSASEKRIGAYLSTMLHAGRQNKQSGILRSSSLWASTNRIHASYLQDMLIPTDAIRKHTALLTEPMLQMARPITHSAYEQDLWIYTTRVLRHGAHVDKAMVYTSQLLKIALEEQGFRRNGSTRVAHLAMEEQGFQDKGGEKEKKPFLIEQPIDGAVKAPQHLRIEQQVILANKAYMKSMLRESFIEASPTPHHAVSETLLTGHKVMKPSLVEQTIVADPQAKLALQMTETPIAKNISMTSRPARLDVEDVRAEYLDAFTYLWPDLPIYDEREDLMIVPNRDFDYSQNIDKLMDANGVPYAALSDVSAPDVQVSLVINHPFPDWAEIGCDEVWVDLAVLKGGIMELIRIWRGAKSKLAGMTLLEGLNYLLQNYYDTLIDFEILDRMKQYRVFRLVRWYAERIVMHRSVIVLHRTYDSWMDKMYGAGDLNAPATIDGFKIDPVVGVLQTISPTATLKMTLTNYVNGDLTMSASVPSGTEETVMTVLLNGVIQRVLSVGDTRRFKMTVPAGVHELEVQWSDPKGGGQALLSGFVLTGAVYAGATTTLEDPKELQGNIAINLLIADLMKYYQDHWDQFKNKGSTGIKQRKPWLNL